MRRGCWELNPVLCKSSKHALGKCQSNKSAEVDDSGPVPSGTFSNQVFTITLWGWLITRRHEAGLSTELESPESTLTFFC